jgi:hypothetical protein
MQNMPKRISDLEAGGEAGAHPPTSQPCVQPPGIVAGAAGGQTRKAQLIHERDQVAKAHAETLRRIREEDFAPEDVLYLHSLLKLEDALSARIELLTTEINLGAAMEEAVSADEKEALNGG